MSRPRIIVVGAGIVGAAVAEALSRDGHDVTIIEQGSPGGAVSGASLACIGTHMTDEEELPLVRWSCAAWAAFADAAPVFEYNRCGQIRFLRKKEELASAEHWLAVERRQGLAPRFLSRAELHTVEPNLTGPVVGATFSPDDAVVNPFLAVRFLLEKACRQGARLKIQQRVDALTLAGESLSGIETTDGPVPADIVILAGGPWTARLAATAGVTLPIVPRKAQCLATTRQPPTVRTVVGACKAKGGVDAGYTQIQQARSGQILFNTVLAGGIAAAGDPDQVPEVDSLFMRDSIATLLNLFPALAEVSLLRSWVRFEAVTPDDRFMVGAVGPAGLFVAAGDGGVGFMRAPAIGQLLADQIAGREPTFEAGCYAPSRFDATQAAA